MKKKLYEKPSMEVFKLRQETAQPQWIASLLWSPLPVS